MANEFQTVFNDPVGQVRNLLNGPNASSVPGAQGLGNFLNPLLQGLGNGLGSNSFLGGKMNKGAKQPAGFLNANSQLPSLDKVPTAQGGFYQNASPTDRTALLKAMIQKSRMGGSGLPPDTGTPSA